MKLKRLDLVYLIITGLLSFLLLFDLFITSGHSAYMDGRAHLTTIAQFYESMKQGVWWVRWTDGFANYGMPLPLFAHQTIGYLGGILSFVFGGDIVLVYKLMFVVGGIISSMLFYLFLRIYFKPLSSFVGTFFFNFAPYRILNLYIREALPEFFASVFFPLILLATYFFVKKKKKWAVPLLVLFFAVIALSHPMMLIVGGILFGGYLLFLLVDEKKRVKTVLSYGMVLLWGLMISAYFVLPLKLENKYFYYGQTTNHLTPGQYLSSVNYLSPKWHYFYERDIVNRGHFVKGGLPETIVLSVGVLYLISRLARDKKKFKPEIVDYATLTGVVLVYMTTRYSGFLYENIDLLSNIQFPWRMLSSYVYVPPIILAYFVNKLRNPRLVVVGVMILIAVLRFPQSYSKNNTLHNIDRYYFTTMNLHSVLMNTVWTGETADYPVHDKKVGIIEGEGVIKSYNVKNGFREYQIEADTSLRLADYTFYFPGWNVYVDGVSTPMEFQDPNYRGVITYKIPEGNHSVVLKFEETRISQYSIIISIFASFSFIVWIVMRQRLK